jgi:hypothetical protein
MDHTHYIYTSPQISDHTWWSEIKVFCSIFIGLFLVVTIVTNAQLYAEVLTSFIAPVVMTSTAIDPTSSIAYEAISPTIIGPSNEDILANQSLIFNTFPSTNRIIIPSLGIDVPFVRSSIQKSVDTATKDDFDKDLYRGVVQYPSTPDP